MGGVSPRLPSLQGEPVGFAHPGASAEGLKDTLDGFQRALDMGATGLEGEVRLTADGVPVLIAGAKFGPAYRRRAIAKVNASDLPDHIPTLGDLYQILEVDFPVSLDMKDPNAFGPTMELVRSVGQTTEPNLWLCHPDLAVLTQWRPQTTARLINSARSQNLPSGLEQRAAELAQLGLDGLKLFHREWAGGSVTLLHRFDLLALGWGTTHSREVAEVVDAGIDAVYSDHVDRMMAVIREYYGGDVTP